VPLFYELIDKACHDHDKELLYHIIDNISELIADFGFVRTGLSLLKFIMQQFETQASVDAIDKVDISSRGGIYGYDLIRLVGNVFSTAKNYFPDEDGPTITLRFATDPDGLGSIKGDKGQSVTYYGLSGQKVERPGRGIFMKKTTFSDGSFTVRKCVLR
jgi:hypothetical protein